MALRTNRPHFVCPRSNLCLPHVLHVLLSPLSSPPSTLPRRYTSARLHIRLHMRRIRPPRPLAHHPCPPRTLLKKCTKTRNRKRFVNLRRVVGHAVDDKDHDQEKEKPVRRAIRQRRFKKGELALAKHPESRKWVVVKILEALPSGR